MLQFFSPDTNRGEYFGCVLAQRRRGLFEGFEIPSKDQRTAAMPDLFIRGAGTYAAHLNVDNPAGTMQSIERALRALDRLAEKEGLELQRLEKTLTDYQAQTGRPFEHEARVKELLSREARLNTALDLDKNDAQAAEAEAEPEIQAVPERSRSESHMRRVQPNSLPTPQF